MLSFPMDDATVSCERDFHQVLNHLSVTIFAKSSRSENRQQFWNTFNCRKTEKKDKKTNKKKTQKKEQEYQALFDLNQAGK